MPSTRDLAGRDVDDEQARLVVDERQAAHPLGLLEGDVGSAADDEVRVAEAALQVGAQEQDGAAEELEGEQADPDTHRPAEEVPTADLANRRAGLLPPAGGWLVTARAHRVKNRPSQGQTQFQPGPRKKAPMMVTPMPKNMMLRKKIHASLRSRAAR